MTSNCAFSSFISLYTAMAFNKYYPAPSAEPVRAVTHLSSKQLSGLVFPDNQMCHPVLMKQLTFDFDSVKEEKLRYRFSGSEFKGSGLKPPEQLVTKEFCLWQVYRAITPQ